MGFDNGNNDNSRTMVFGKALGNGGAASDATMIFGKAAASGTGGGPDDDKLSLFDEIANEYRETVGSADAYASAAQSDRSAAAGAGAHTGLAQTPEAAAAQSAGADGDGGAFAWLDDFAKGNVPEDGGADAKQDIWDAYAALPADGADPAAGTDVHTSPAQSAGTDAAGGGHGFKGLFGFEEPTRRDWNAGDDAAGRGATAVQSDAASKAQPRTAASPQMDGGGELGEAKGDGRSGDMAAAGNGTRGAGGRTAARRGESGRGGSRSRSRREARRGSADGAGGAGGKKGKGGRRRPHIVVRILKAFFSAILVALIIAMCYGVFTVFNTVKDLPHHDPSEVQNGLKTMSTIYDDSGTPLKDIYLDDGLRTLVTYDQLPDNLVNAIVSVEDRTFWTHKGFNLLRMAGAVRDSVLHGGSISGTSTITQQLARNIWLMDVRSERTLDRKIKEAYYARELEKGLSKKEILTAYLNTIALGNHSYGVGAAAQSYFNKDVSQLDLLECAALAALPASPTNYSMIATVGIGEVAPDDPRVLLVTDQYIFLYNATAESRIKLVLDLMLAQGYISQEEHDRAYSDDIRTRLHPRALETTSNASFFIDYLIPQVARHMFERNPGLFDDYDEALQQVYSGGLEIHSTFSQRMQDIVTEEFNNPENYPATNMPLDSAGNCKGPDDQILLYAYGNMFSDSENGPMFFLNPGDFEIRQDGTMLLYKGKRLGIYDTTNPDGSSEVAVEFWDFFEKIDEKIYTTRGGIVSIPRQYKGMDSQGNLILSADFINGPESIFTVDENGTYWIDPSHFSLRQRIVQPQGATTIIEHHTGQIKAMFGGREVTGQMQYNRATTPHPPGSTMKPLGAYGPAIEMSANHEPTGSEIKTFGDYWTPLSIIVDEKMEYNGKVWPDNWYSGYRGPQTLRNAIEQSLNICAVKVQLAVGNQRSVNFLKKLGITTLVEEGATNDLGPAALALGGMTVGLTPLEISSAYGTFANLGVHVEPIAYTSVTDRAGGVVLDGTPKKSQAMDPGTAYIVNDMLRTTVSHGIAGAARVAGIQVAGKTGTNEKRNYDAWFVGNTPAYSMGVWIGCDSKIPMSKNSSVSASMYSKIMTRVYEGLEPGEFEPKPDNVVSATVDEMSDIFIDGTVPDKLNNGTEELDVCVDSGFLATPWCPGHEMRMFDTLNSTSTDDAEHPLPPEYYCHMHNLDPGQFPNDPNYPINNDFWKKKVPELAGLAIGDAQAALNNAGLNLGTVAYYYSDTVATNAVIKSTPPAGTLLEPGTTVNLDVSKGQDPATAFVSVPNVVGYSLADASTVLANAGLRIGQQIPAQQNTNYTSGVVLMQNPVPGESRQRGTAVDVWYNP